MYALLHRDMPWAGTARVTARVTAPNIWSWEAEHHVATSSHTPIHPASLHHSPALKQAPGSTHTRQLPHCHSEPTIISAEPQPQGKVPTMLRTNMPQVSLSELCMCHGLR
eukprot:scaffold138647_cov22-Tisochrysis_lutea.AAC.1